MEVAEGFLIGADEEDGDVIGLVGLEFVEGQDFGDVLLVDEAVDFAVAIAGDVGEHGALAGFFVEPVDGHDGEELVDGPGVRQGLEQREVSVVEIHQGGGQLAEVFRDVIELGDEVGDAGEDVPEPGFGQAALAQRGAAIEKLRAHLVAVIGGVVEAFLEVFLAERLVDVDQVESGSAGRFPGPTGASSLVWALVTSRMLKTSTE